MSLFGCSTLQVGEGYGVSIATKGVSEASKESICVNDS